MKTKLAVAVALLLGLSTGFAADVYVQPYVRSDGTYVDGHYRTAPNSTRLDNYSTYPNVNPYSGQQGTKDPYQQYDFNNNYDSGSRRHRKSDW